MASVRPLYRVSLVFRGLCWTMWCVKNSGFSSTIFSSSNSHSHWIVTLYPALAICSILFIVRSYLSPIVSTPDVLRSLKVREVWPLNSNKKTRTRFLSLYNKRPQCRTENPAVWIRVLFWNVIFYFQQLAACVKARSRPSYCNFGYSCIRQRKSVLLCSVSEISYATLYYKHWR